MATLIRITRLFKVCAVDGFWGGGLAAREDSVLTLTGNVLIHFVSFYFCSVNGWYPSCLCQTLPETQRWSQINLATRMEAVLYADL